MTEAYPLETYVRQYIDERRCAGWIYSAESLAENFVKKLPDHLRSRETCARVVRIIETLLPSHTNGNGTKVVAGVCARIRKHK